MMASIILLNSFRFEAKNVCYQQWNDGNQKISDVKIYQNLYFYGYHRQKSTQNTNI